MVYILIWNINCEFLLKCLWKRIGSVWSQSNSQVYKFKTSLHIRVGLISMMCLVKTTKILIESNFQKEVPENKPTSCLKTSVPSLQCLFPQLSWRAIVSILYFCFYSINPHWFCLILFPYRFDFLEFCLKNISYIFALCQDSCLLCTVSLIFLSLVYRDPHPQKLIVCSGSDKKPKY